MHRQQRQFLIQRDAVRMRLPNSRVHRDYYVAKHVRHSRKRGRSRKIARLFRLREGKHVSRLVFAAPVAVQGVYRVVIGQQNAYLGARAILGLQQTAHGLLQHRRSDGLRLIVA